METMFYDPNAGEILLDGHDLRDLSLRSLRENVAVLLQETLVFDGTVRENIAYGRPGAPRKTSSAWQRTPTPTGSSARCPRVTTRW
jgi:ATP-binding cassette, subfamily B, bacterial